MESKKYADKWFINRRVKVFYTNVDGLIDKRLEYIEKEKLGILCLIEIKLSRKVDSKALGLENYAVYRKDREGKRGGGIMIIVEEKLKSKRKVLPKTGQRSWRLIGKTEKVKSCILRSFISHQRLKYGRLKSMRD